MQQQRRRISLKQYLTWNYLHCKQILISKLKLFRREKFKTRKILAKRVICRVQWWKKCHKHTLQSNFWQVHRLIEWWQKFNWYCKHLLSGRSIIKSQQNFNFYSQVSCSITSLNGSPAGQSKSSSDPLSASLSTASNCFSPWLMASQMPLPKRTRQCLDYGGWNRGSSERWLKAMIYWVAQGCSLAIGELDE